MPHRALITGVSGFAGGFLSEHLLDSGDAVLGTAPDGRWMESSPEAICGRVELVAWDLGDAEGCPEDVRRRIEAFRPDVVYHLAAVSVPKDCGGDEPKRQAMAVNVGGTRRVLELAASLPSRPRVVFISSNHVYAPVDRRSPQVDEDAPLGPQWAYGQTKLAGEREVRRAVDELGVEAVISRSFQHTGPRQAPRMMLPQWIRQFVMGGPGPVEVYTRDAWLDLTDVRDVVRAYRLLAERGASGRVYNVGSGINRRSGDVLELLRAQTDARRPIVELRPGFRQEPIADNARLARETGWRATIPLEQTVSDTLAWWRRRLATSGRNPTQVEGSKP